MKKNEHISDERIIELYWLRNEAAITETSEKYGGYCRSIAYNILHDTEDAKECENDTYLDAWNNMPPNKPSVLSAFLGKITRRISIDLWRKKHAEKRGGGEMDLVLDELEDCIADKSDVEAVIDQQETARIISEFLDGLSVTERSVFLRRYWYAMSVKDIARGLRLCESHVSVILHRTRRRFKEHLTKEGIFV